MDPTVLNLRRSLGGEFPYRAYTKGNAHAIERLVSLMLRSGSYESKNWEIAPGHLVTKIPDFKTRFPYIPIVVPEPIWELDETLDLYTEKSRMATPGYGDSHSAYDYWTMSSLEPRIVSLTTPDVTPYQLRERFNKGLNKRGKIPEARLAYATVSQGIYSALHYLHAYVKGAGTVPSPIPPLSILDISAYGDRPVAAASMGSPYTGIDPDSALVTGHHHLKMDLNLACTRLGREEPIINLYAVPLEGFESIKQFDLMTISPPPFDQEPYGGENTADPQTHQRYTDVDSYFNGFIYELVLRAKRWVKTGGLFAFTALDRIPTGRNERGITYVEALLLLIKSTSV